jgi:FkbM family methyltransferase
MSLLPKKFTSGLGDALVNLLPRLIYFSAERSARTGLRLEANETFMSIIDVSRLRIIRISRTNAVYAIDMLNYFDYYFSSSKPFSTRVGDTQYEVVDFSTPRFHEISGFSDFPVLCPSLTEPFITCQQYLDFSRSRNGDVVLDLGCYSGLTSIAFSKIVGVQGKVVAVEPDPLSYAAAQTNFDFHARINKLNNIFLVRAAVGADKGKISFSSEGAMGSAAADIVGTNRGQATQVESLRLQDIVDAQEITKVDFIKMDIEGSEERVLAASKGFFDRFKPRIIVEPHIVNGRLSDSSVVGALRSYGYRCNLIEQHGVKLPLITGEPSN